jgi:hypothetical protein
VGPVLPKKMMIEGIDISKIDTLMLLVSDQ